MPDIEVIAFTAATTPETRARHWWGAKADGWIDWSLGPTPVSAAERVHRANASAGTTIYDAPVAGGRVTKDGSKHVQWKVAFPVLANGERRGVKPFWCEDVTERGWRVRAFSCRPLSAENEPLAKYKFPTSQVPEPAPHPNGATGIHALTLLAPPGDLEAYLTTLSPILSVAPAAALHQFEIATPVGSSVQVFVREPADEGEVAWVAERGAGLWEVELATAAGASRVKIGASAGARLVL